MNTTEPIRPSTFGAPGLGDRLADLVPLVGTIYVAGPPVLVAWAGTVLLALMLAGPFLLLVTLVVALVAAAALVALAAAILATPYLLVRHVRGHWPRHTTRDTEPQLVAVTSQRAIA
jgi:hypothetical protein